MKSWKIAVPVVAICLLIAASAFAATTTMNSHSTGSTAGNWTFGITGGTSIPTGDYGELASAGWNFGGQADYWMNSMWGFGADFAYHANNGSDDLNASLVADPFYGPGTEAKFSSMQYGVHATYLIPTQGGSIFPFVQGGVAGYNIKSTIDGGLSPGDVSENKFGVNIGTGVDFRATDVVNFGVGGTYHYVTTDPSINWFGVQGRVSFKMPTK